MRTKDRILVTSVDLFNRSGVVAITTNHIAKELGMSPGNLYFHYRNKEEIICEIFKLMSKETYQLWKVSKSQKMMHPLELIEKNFELFWKYRFFHREMYYLRRKDPVLAKMWKNHIQKILKLMTLMYRKWVKNNWMKAIESEAETQFIVNVLLATASTFLQFFESADRLPAKRHIENGQIYVARLLVHYTTGEMSQDFEKAVQRIKS